MGELEEKIAAVTPSGDDEYGGRGTNGEGRKTRTKGRAWKNILMIILILAVCGATVATGYFAAENLKTTGGAGEMGMGMGGEMNGMSGDMSEPPEKPEGEATDETVPEKPEGESSDSEAPEKPDGDTTTDESVPEKPDGESSGMPNADNDYGMAIGAGEMEMGEMGEMGGMTETASSELGLGFYLGFALEGAVFAFLIIYMIMSRANRRNFRETFKNGDKVVIMILMVLIAAGGFAYGGKVIAEKLAENMTATTGEKTETGGNNTEVSYAAATTITSDTEISGESYESTTGDENAVLVSGEINVTLSNISVNKTGEGSSGDNTNFYGTNAAILAKGGANLTIKNATITTDASGANGVFSFGGSATTGNNTTNAGDGTTVSISDSTITTLKDNSGGIMTTGGGVMNATNLTISTAGVSSAAIRSDRGGGVVSVDGGTYTTTGAGSPAVYSTAKITVKNATLNSEASEGIVIEGKNSVALENVTLTDNNNKLNGQSTTYKNVFLYQSMSGDAAEGQASFSAKNSSILTEKGDSFYVTNTSAEITLAHNSIANSDESGNFLRIQADSWGNSGSNGGEVVMNLSDQTAGGDIVVDSISTLTLNLADGSEFTGAINSENTAKSITLTISSDSTLVLTADTYVSSLTDADASYSNIVFNGFKLYVANEAIN